MPTFEKIFAKTLINYEQTRPRTVISPSAERMLIVAGDRFAADLSPLVDWKRRRGIEVDVLPMAAIGLTPADAIAVGDGANDLAMLNAAGAGVALHAKPAVAAQCSLRVNHGDLTALLYLQGYTREEFAQ